MGSPVANISKAFFYEVTLLAIATPGVVQNKPIFTPGA